MPEGGYWYLELVTGKNYVVHVKGIDPDMLHFDESAWIAHTGEQCRLGQFIKEGPNGSSEIEVLGPGMFPRSLIAGLWPWGHAMVMTQ